jgi:ABC-type multidrug transport system ATPase subunit
MPAITCQQLCVHYGKTPVVKNVDLQITTGECFGLVGENGAGKSTLIKSMLDLIAIKSGSCEFFGVSHRIVSSRGRLAYLPDRFVPPYYLKAKDFLRYMADIHGQSFNPDIAQDMLRLLDLDVSALDKSVRELSKGMTQKIGLASCFLSNRDLLILDEPMSGLDPRARACVKKQIMELKRQGKTLFFSSHMLADVEEIADRMAVLHRGEIQFTGTPQQFMQQHDAPNMEAAYLACTDA